MIPVIVGQAFGRYVAAVASVMLRMLALIALVIMPFGMTAAPAQAQPVHHAMAMAGNGHCDEQQDQHRAPTRNQTDCAAACTALPAPAEPILARPLKPKAPRAVALVAPFHGIVLEIATPPPRLV